MFRLICFLLGYGIGCIQFASLVSKSHGVDIREHGSGNPGATNTLRVLGKTAGFTVLGLDASKSVLAYIIASLIFGGVGTFVWWGDVGLGILPGLYAGFGAVVGHVYPVQKNFSGGKGVSCIAGIILAINFFMSVIIFAMGVVILMLTKYASLANLSVVLALPIALLLLGHPLEAVAVSSLIVALCFYKHKNNIKALLNGTERAFKWSKK